MTYIDPEDAWQRPGSKMCQMMPRSPKVYPKVYPKRPQSLPNDPQTIPRGLKPIPENNFGEQCCKKNILKTDIKHQAAVMVELWIGKLVFL